MTSRLGLTPHRNVFGSTFFSLTGFHGFHVLAGLALLSILFVLVMGGKFKGERTTWRSRPSRCTGTSSTASG